MDFTIKNDKNEIINIKISFDEFGNLYFEDNYIIYQININSKNNLYADIGDYKLLSNENNFKKSKFSLDKKLTKKIKNDLDNNYFEENYYPEDNEYYEYSFINDDHDIYYNEDVIKKYGTNNQPFNFSTNNTYNIFPVNNRENGHVMALYDSYVYKNNKLLFKSNSYNNESYYRLNIHLEGYIYFRPIGNSITKYNPIKLSSSNIIILKTE